MFETKVNFFLNRNLTAVLSFLLLILLTLSCFPLIAQRSNVMQHKDLLMFQMAKRIFYKGEQLYKKGKHAKAEAAFLNCLKKFPNYSHADFFLSRIYYEKKDYLQALMYIERAKKNHKAFAALATSSHMEYLDQLKNTQEEKEREIRMLKEQLFQLPPNPPPLSAAAQTKIRLENAIREKQRTLELVKDKIRKPITDMPEIPADYHYNHANVLFRLKKFNEAFSEYQLTVQKKPNYGNAYSNLANLYYMVKKYELAMEFLGKAEKYGVKVNSNFKAALLEATKNQQK